MAPETPILFNVLVINDDVTQRERISRAIEGRCKVDTPASYETMMKKVYLLMKVPKAYDLVILDYVLELWPLPPQQSPEEQLPKNGFEILQLLYPTKRETEPLIYFLTNFPSPGLMKQVRKEYGVVTAKESTTTPQTIRDDVEKLLGVNFSQER